MQQNHAASQTMPVTEGAVAYLAHLVGQLATIQKVRGSFPSPGEVRWLRRYDSNNHRRCGSDKHRRCGSDKHGRLAVTHIRDVAVTNIGDVAVTNTGDWQ
ncbi:hypothetical protein PoB_006874500 [Plakobranchus ocellatus]|uniref:Uncharacterized protein n=1 Tax=Plakobranchus ocellatus TaxID=259542 RepID=A0AAV4DE80_9GAST|nr:hypothetical protein PoB_006874500 [Plakobranchus ocellatus]